MHPRYFSVFVFGLFAITLQLLCTFVCFETIIFAIFKLHMALLKTH